MRQEAACSSEEGDKFTRQTTARILACTMHFSPLYYTHRRDTAAPTRTLWAAGTDLYVKCSKSSEAGIGVLHVVVVMQAIQQPCMQIKLTCSSVLHVQRHVSTNRNAGFSLQGCTARKPAATDREEEKRVNRGVRKREAVVGGRRGSGLCNLCGWQE